MIRRIEDNFQVNSSDGRTVGLDSNYVTLSGGGAAQVSGFGQWTTGCTLIQAVPNLFPPQSELAQLISFTIGARAMLDISNLAGVIPFGRLGRVLAGLTTTGNPTARTTPPNFFIPYVNKALPLPNDLTLVGPLFDPGSDPLPPILPPGTDYDVQAVLPLQLSQTLPQPIPIPRASNLNVGIWMLPSLIGASQGGGAQPPSLRLHLIDGTYSIVYDDGQG